ncbi:hypothetical protein ANN_12677 [Periplaneta americana]|uniref:Uncharacterized protein n=1 Tax=Periplaneta americana TaxID=6978 RepID=A0ABQ8TH75_PERAM|nr:hypothetical protein ANN_12677 [Periplaneta americana]
MAGLCKGGNEPPGSLKASNRGVGVGDEWRYVHEMQFVGDMTKVLGRSVGILTFRARVSDVCNHKMKTGVLNPSAVDCKLLIEIRLHNKDAEATLRPTPKLEDHPSSAVRDAYSIYSQLSSISGGRLLNPEPEDAPCRGDRDPKYMESNWP